MNDPEVTMSKAVPETKLVAHEKAVEAAGIAITLVMRVPAVWFGVSGNPKFKFQNSKSDLPTSRFPG